MFDPKTQKKKYFLATLAKIQLIYIINVMTKTMANMAHLIYKVFFFFLAKYHIYKVDHYCQGHCNS